MNPFIVEYLGTLFFLYIILLSGNAVAIGAALTLVILLGGAISGGHFNPAVTVMMVMANKLPSSEVFPYILAQVAGGITALELYRRVPLRFH